MEQAGAGDGRIRSPQLRPVRLHVAEIVDTGDDLHFSAALERALTDGIRDGQISSDVYEALLTAPGFDPRTVRDRPRSVQITKIRRVRS